MGKDRDISRLQMKRTGEPSQAQLHADWAADLNSQQLAAVTAPDGPVLVLAGAGSGKTRVITHRVAYLLAERRMKPQNILLLTFTNKAAKSMLQRAGQVVGPAARDVTGGTFHHFANLQLRKYAKALGYENNFSILDESDSVSVMRTVRSDLQFDKGERAFPSAKLLTKIDSTVVNTGRDLETILTRNFPQILDFFSEIERVLAEYRGRKFASNQMGFDDLLVNLERLLTEQEEVRLRISRRYAHVLVDEYQDVNHIQARIVRRLYEGSADRSGAALSAPDPGRGLTPEPLDKDNESALEPGLAILPPGVQRGFGKDRTEAGPGPKNDEPVQPAEGRGLFVVGDDAQSIYSFRGADYRNIRQFPQHYPNSAIFKLETNYRSVPEVLTLANGVMDDADPMFKKNLAPVKDRGEMNPLLLACGSVEEQTEFVSEQILKLREEEGIDYRQIAVLYRAHNNRMEVELDFTHRGIPFVVRGGLRFFEQAHIKDLVSYLSVVANSRDELAWQRIMQMCSRVGPKTISAVLTKLRAAADEPGGMLGRFINNGAVESARGQGKKSLKELQDFLKSLEADAERLPVPDLVQRVLDERYARYMELTYENWRQRKDDLDQLVLYANRFNSLAAFLSDIGLSTDISGSRTGEGSTPDDPEEGAVTLSTIHQAKGLEWRVVFIIHCQDDVIPHRMTHFDASELDEERRLLYVAITRAEELLFLTYPQMVETRDFQRIINRPSRFLNDLPADCYDEATLDWN